MFDTGETVNLQSVNTWSLTVGVTHAIIRLQHAPPNNTQHWDITVLHQGVTAWSQSAGTYPAFAHAFATAHELLHPGISATPTWDITVIEAALTMAQ